MLLFNFLCLFFLMVLTNSHTISKSIVKNDEVINVIDSVHDIEDDKQHDIKQNRYHHRLGFRAEPMENRQIESITSVPNDDQYFTIQVSEHTDEVQVSKSRRRGFLRRLMDKIKRRKNKDLATNGKIEQVGTTPWNIAATKSLYVNNKTTAKVNGNSYTRPKRSHHNKKYRRKILSKRFNDPATNKIQSVIYDEDLFQNFKHISADSEKDKRKSLKDNDSWENYYQLTSMRSYQPIYKKDNELSLSEMTTKIDYLKEKYSIKPRLQNFTKYIPSLANSFDGYNFNQYESSTMATTLLKIDDYDKDLTDTDEIEDLLNIMKMRAVQIIANKNPVVTDIVSNSGAETLFETVPSFKDMFSLGRTFSLGNYIPVNAYDVTKLPPTVKTIMVRNIYKTPKQKTNVKREVVRNGEVLKNMYNNFKNQLSSEIKESQTALKNETKYWANKFTDKHTTNCNSTKKSVSHFFMYKTIEDDDLGSNQDRDRKSILKHGITKQITDNFTYAIPHNDNEYAMLSLYEKLLRKPHQENLMVLSTTESIKKRNAVENHVIYNRNHKIFSHLEDKEKDLDVPYKTVDSTDEYDEYEGIQNEESTEKFGPTPQKNKELSGKTTTFKDLADKLSYNDYVNGYKHYLKFQKEQGAQNYSNLVRYQAHRHHSVDDIGKFILNKLPQVPERHKRAFYDESETTEDLDISTTNEESWFKKHFYLFIDSGQPKKFHSSETVSLRPPVAETDKVQHSSTGNSFEKPSTMKARKIQKKIEDTDLDRLSNVLEKYKDHPTPSTTTRRRHISNGYHTTLAEVTNYGTADASVKFKDMIGKLFGGKKLRNAKPSSELDYRDMAKRNMISGADIDLLLDNALRRFKRNTYVADTNNEYQLYHNYLPKEEIKSEKQFRSSDLSSTNSYKNYGYVDVNVITRPTAVVKLREAKNESKLKKFFKHLSFNFHKKKDKEIKKSKIHKREPLHRVQRSNPLKKLKEMFNLRIDGKPDTRSKVFDYDIIDAHVSSFKPFRYDKTSYLEETNIEIPNVTEDVLYKAKTEANDISYKAPVLKNSLLAKKYFQHNALKNDLTTASETYTFIADPSEILIATKNSPPKTQVIPKSNSSSKSKLKFTPSDLINIKVTTVKSPKKHITYDMYDSVEAPFLTIASFDNTLKPIRKLSLANETPNHILDFFKNINLRTAKKDSSVENKDKESNKLIISEYPFNELNFLPNIEINHEYFSPYNTGDVAVDEENSQETEAVSGNLKGKAKLSEKPKNMTSQNTKKRTLTSVRHRYQTIPDYFKDFERWHNDLLHSEKFTTWQNILNDINHSYKYSPPNVTCLKKELSRMHGFLDIHNYENIKGDNNRDRLQGIKKEMLTTETSINLMKRKTAKAALKKSSLKCRNLVKRGEGETNNVLNFYHNSNEGKLDTHQNHSITNTEVKNLTRIVSEKYHKLIHPMSHNVQIEDSSKTENSSKGTITPINTDNAPETTYFMDNTLLAYDDGFNFITEKVAEANDAPTLQSSLNMHAIDAINSVTKLHKVPEQYFATPIPMEKKDFDKFLKEHDLDVLSVTSPLSQSSRKTIMKNERQYDSTSFINFKNIPDQYNKLKQSFKISKPIDFKNMSENTKDVSFDSISMDKVGKEYNMGSKVESENTFVDRYNCKINRGYDDKRRKRETFKSSQAEEPTAWSLGYGIYSKYNKLKDQFKIFDRMDEETKDTMSSSSNILDEVEGTVTDYDNLEDLQFDNTKVSEKANSKYIKSESATKGEEFNKSFIKGENKPLHKKVTINNFEHRNNYTKKGPAVSGKKLKTYASHKILEKAKPHGNNLMHNNLLFSYMVGDGKKQTINNTSEIVNATSLTNDKHHNYGVPIKMLQDSKLAHPNIRMAKSSNPKRIQITNNSYKYDIIYEDNFSEKRNVNNKETTTPRLQVFGQHGFYAMKVNGSANDSENEKIIQLVKVVEAVENYTRPNILIRIDLPTYYLPNTDQTELAPIQSPPKSIWNDYILKYISGIALIELLTKFGILKTVETNLTDGMDENVNACGVFSGAAEPRLAMDLTLDNGARRVQRSQKDNSSTSRPLRKATSEPLRRGTLIYNLKQMDRPNNHETKQHRGPFKSLHGTSVLSLLQKQRQMRLNETKRTPTSKSSDKPSTENHTENSSTTTLNNSTVKNISGYSKGKNPHESLKQNKDVKNTNITNAVERTLPVKEDVKTKATTTPKRKCSKSLKAKTHTTSAVSNENRKETTKNAGTTHNKANVKDIKTKNRQHLVIITKIESDKKQKLSDYEFVFPNTKILPTKAEVTSEIAKVTSGPNEQTETTKEKYTTTKAPSSTRNVSSTTKANTVVTFISEIGTVFSQSEFDLKAPADEDSFYVTSDNYYDYHTGDLEYNLNESKVVKIENTTKMKNDSAVKHDKRDIRSQNTFTAKDVAAIEVIVDLMRNTRNSEENDLVDTINENTETTLSDSGQASSRVNDIASNAIQVHIAIPYNLSNEKRRSLNDPVKLRKVFSAKLSTPVDMEYQIHSAEGLEPSSSESDIGTSSSTSKLSATSLKMDALSPGMYLLEENMNSLMPKGKYILRPIYNKRFLSDCKIRQAVTKSIITDKVAIATPPDNLAKVTLSKDFIAALDQHLQQLYQNLTSAPEHKIKARHIDLCKILKHKHVPVHRPRRHINWDTIKKYFGHDRVCNCHCKPNRTMCRACAASDAVISELIFELNNLAQYMNDHCTEIQTYFWMNPSGGRKLREAVQRIDKTLYNYYKRVKGKCKGRPCKTFTYVDKRDFDKSVNYIGEPLIRDIEKIADDLEQASKFNIGDDSLAKTGIKCLDVITKCMHLKPFNKRADESIGNKNRLRNVYSLDNVNVNIICKSDSQMDKTQNNICLSTLTSTYLTESPSVFYYDMDEFKNEEKRKKGIKYFLSRKTNMKKKRKNKSNLFTYYVTPSESRVSSNDMRLKKRQINNNQIESPLITDTGGLFWFDYINGNKNKNQFVEERSNKDNNYNFQRNHDLTESNDNIINTENSIDYEYSSFKNSRVNDINQNDLTKSANTFKSFMSNNNVSQFTTQNMQTTKTKPKMFRLTAIPNKMIDVNQSKSIRHRIKELLELLDADDFGSFEESPFLGQNKHKTSFVETLETQKHRKRKIFNKAFQRYTKQDTSSTTTTMNTSMLFQPTSVNTEITSSSFSTSTTARNKVNVTRRSYLTRFKEATLKFLDKLDGTDNFIIDEKTTTPIYVYGKKFTGNNRVFTNLFVNRKRDLKSSKDNKNDVAGDHDIRGDAINIRDNIPDDEHLKDDLDLISNSLELVKDSNKNKELLLSILDFETNKLNDEWTRIEKRKTAVEDSKYDMGDVGQTIFQRHSDFNNIVSEKATLTKVDCATTAESIQNQTIALQCKNITNTTKTNATDSQGGCGKCYDIVKDMRDLELSVPPELTSTRAHNGFLDKFIHKFAFKNVPDPQKKKAVNTHPNAPKERSLRGKMEHGKRYHGKVHCKTKPNKNGTDFEDLEQPMSSLNTLTVTIKATKLKTTVDTTNKSPTTTSTTKKSTRTTTVSEIGNDDATTPDHSKENIGTTNENSENEEVYEPNAQPTKYICDIDASVAHIQEMFQRLSKNDFGKYVKNISCFKYKKAPSAFYIKATSMQSKKRSKFHSKTGHIHTNLTKKILNWNWIRDKRSSHPNSYAYGDFINAKDFDNDYFDDIDDESKGFAVENLKGNLQYALRDEKEDYDKLYLDGDGVYRRRENERKKRGAVDMTDVVNGLRNLPPLRPLIDEIFVIRGDSTTIQCNASGFPLYSYSNLSNFDQYTWSAERKAMLQCSNTKVFGPTISIVNVQPRNFGTYTCYKDKSVIRSVKLNVIVIPDFNVVFTPLYKCQSECTYEDLMNIQKLGPMMSKAMCSGDDEPDSIRIDEPVCMSNKENENLLKPTVVMKPSPQPTIECSPECQRDVKCSLALLWASNAPSLALVKVVIFYDDFNKTLTPLDTCDSDLTTVMALKKKDSNGHHEYRRLVLDMELGNVDVVVTCPAGFYLLADQKICAVCPVDTCSLAGENTCTACPRGTHAPPGSCACRLAFGPHRINGAYSDWFGIHKGVRQGCVASPWLFNLFMDSCLENLKVEECGLRMGVPGCLSAAQTQGRVRRPLSPSRVLLERIFKRSPSSSRATDSQETRFGMWKERNGPPPLPPIDFDL